MLCEASKHLNNNVYGTCLLMILPYFLLSFSGNKMKKKKCYNVRTILGSNRKTKKYHNVRTILGSNRKTKQYHNVKTILKSNRKPTHTTMSEQF